MSNMFAYLLDGDVSLSVTMTGISTVGSLGRMFSLYRQNIGIEYRFVMNDECYQCYEFVLQHALKQNI